MRVALPISAVLAAAVLLVAGGVSYFRPATETAADRTDAAAPSAATGPAVTPIAAAETDEAPRPADVTGDTGVPVVVEPPGPAPPGMVWIPGGTFRMGNPAPEPNQQDEAPIHAVTIDGFWMDATEVTNAEFARFVAATGYVTAAERRIDREDFRGQVPEAALVAIPDENLDPSSICFNSNFDPATIDKSDPRWPYSVWNVVKGADWRHPEGPASSIESRGDHPVVHVLRCRPVPRQRGHLHRPNRWAR